VYKTGDLIKKGHSVITADPTETMILLRDIVLYLTTVRWHSDPDFGMWEEGPEIHSSSIGSVLAGLTMWHDDGYYHHKYTHQVDLHSYLPILDLHSYLPIPQEFIELGRDSLDRVLPAESQGRPYDLSQLSLIWPYNIVTEGQARRILANVERNLLRERGVIRYPGDMYYTSDTENPVGNEAEWPLGLAWLSIVYSKLALRSIRTGNIFGPPAKFVERSEYYLERMEKVMTDDGKAPELYHNGQMNWNVPLAWAQSLYVVARQNLNWVHEELER
jgi:phosphorylase kinase alpha/beta subunit